MPVRPRFALNAFFAVFALLSPLTAQNSFHFSDSNVLTGSEGNTIDLLCDNDIDVLGFSFGVNYDQDVIVVTGVSRAGTTAEDADYYEGQVESETGLIGYGCVFDLDGDFSKQKLPPGSDNLIAIIAFDVAAAVSTDTDSPLSLEDVALAPNTEAPVRNVLTNDEGRSVVPDLDSGTIEIRAETPAITEVQGGTGRTGDVFQVIGEHFGHDGLAVTVCDQAADATLRGDGVTIDVTAPECPERDVTTEDCRDVVVSTVRGSDTGTDGFCYTEDPIPAISGISPSSGFADDVFTLTGVNFDQPGIAITVCGSGASFDNLAADGTSVDVTAPSCPEGDQDVVLSTDFGADSATFTYLPSPVPVITGVSPGEGQADTVITLTGTHFDETGLAITICGITVAAQNLAADGTSVDVTAPECPVGDAAIVLTTDFGEATAAFTYLPTETLFVRGDANSDSGIDLTDGVTILGFLFLGFDPPPCEDAADADDNGSLELTDAVKIFNWLFLGGSSPPPPSPSSGSYPASDCGADPTEDALDCEITSATCS